MDGATTYSLLRSKWTKFDMYSVPHLIISRPTSGDALIEQPVLLASSCVQLSEML